MARRSWFSPVSLGLVILGGVLGVAARAIIVVPLTVPGGTVHPLVVPAVTLGINLVGSFLLGAVVGWAGESRPRLRLFLGTGVVGGFTTYSAFAVQASTVSAALPVVGVALMALSLFGGVLAAALGLGWGLRLTAPEVGGQTDAGSLPPEDAE